MVQIQRMERVRNFAQKKEYKCMECGVVLSNPKDLYTRRFCSVECKDKYFQKI